MQHFRAFFLIWVVWLSLQDQVTIIVGKNSMFIFFSCVAWPLGFITTMILYLHAGSTKLDFIANYVIPQNCQSNFTFFLMDNGTRCLIEHDGAAVWTLYYSVICALVIATNAIFFMVFMLTYNDWRKTKQLIDQRDVQFLVKYKLLVCYVYSRDM